MSKSSMKFDRNTRRGQREELSADASRKNHGGPFILGQPPNISGCPKNGQEAHLQTVRNLRENAPGWSDKHGKKDPLLHTCSPLNDFAVYYVKTQTLNASPKSPKNGIFGGVKKSLLEGFFDQDRFGIGSMTEQRQSPHGFDGP